MLFLGVNGSDASGVVLSDDALEFFGKVASSDVNHDPGYENWASQTHLKEQYKLLPRSETTEVYGRQTADGHRTDAVEQRIDVRYVVPSIAGIKYSRKDQRCECEEQQMNTKEIKMFFDVSPAHVRRQRRRTNRGHESAKTVTVGSREVAPELARGIGARTENPQRLSNKVTR